MELFAMSYYTAWQTTWNIHLSVQSGPVCWSPGRHFDDFWLAGLHSITPDAAMDLSCGRYDYLGRNCMHDCANKCPPLQIQQADVFIVNSQNKQAQTVMETRHLVVYIHHHFITSCPYTSFNLNQWLQKQHFMFWHSCSLQHWKALMRLTIVVATHLVKKIIIIVRYWGKGSLAHN